MWLYEALDVSEAPFARVLHRRACVCLCVCQAPLASNLFRLVHAHPSPALSSTMNEQAWADASRAAESMAAESRRRALIAWQWPEGSAPPAKHRFRSRTPPSPTRPRPPSSTLADMASIQAEHHARMASFKAASESLKAASEWRERNHERKAGSMMVCNISSGDDDDNGDRRVGAAAAGPARPVAAAAALELPEPAALDRRRHPVSS